MCETIDRIPDLVMFHREIAIALVSLRFDAKGVKTDDVTLAVNGE